MADGISFTRTDEQSMLASTLREFLEATVDDDRTREMSTTDDSFDGPVWDGLRDMGLFGLHIPEAYGGAGFTTVEVGIVFEELGRKVASVPLLSTALAATAILEAGDDDLRQHWLPGLASGEMIGTLAMHESAHDITVGGGETSVVPDGDGWILDGAKRFVTDAVHADVFVVVAAVPDGMALAVVPARAAGVEVVPTHALDATRPIGEVRFTGVRLDSASVCVDAEAAVSTAIDMGVVCLACEQVGGAQWGLETSVAYAKTRFQFGRAIGSFQAVKHKCADMLVAVEHAKSAAWHAAASFEDPEEAAIAIPVARSVCSDAALAVAGETIQVLGGIGFTWEHAAHLYLKRAKSTSLLFGSTGMWRDRLADAVGIR
ncbi:MAG: acyl-CoA dehydrogenase family protein [Acidimicrobiia bacterium]